MTSSGRNFHLYKLIQIDADMLNDKQQLDKNTDDVLQMIDHKMTMLVVQFYILILMMKLLKEY